MINIVENRVRKERDMLFNNNFFINLKKGNYKKENLKIFSEQYYVLSSNFINLLFYACLRIKLEEEKLPIIRNIWDEFGNGNIDNSHRSLLNKFIVATGSSTQNIVMLESTKTYILDMSCLYNKWSEVEVLSALGVGCEALTSDQYKIIIDPLINIYSFSKDALLFFTKHIQHDSVHTTEIYSVLEKYLQTDENIELAVNSAKEVILNELRFWNGIHNAIRG